MSDGSNGSNGSNGRVLRQATVILKIKVGKFGTRKQLRAGDIIDDVTIDPDLVHVTKEILDASALKAVRDHDSQFRTWLQARRIECDLLASGMYLIPLALVSQVDDQLTWYEAERQRLVAAFSGEYEALVEGARTRLGPLYDEVDYPPVADVIEQFYTRSTYLEFNVAEGLASVSRERYEVERLKVERQWDVAYDEVRDALRISFAKLVEHMAKQLGPDPTTGRPRKIYDSMMEKMTTFLDTFAARNLTSDTDLAALVEQAREITSGVTAQTLRQVSATREAIQTSMSQIQEHLQEMIQTMPARRIRLESTEPALG